MPSVSVAMRYYDEFRRKMNLDPSKQLKIAMIYSYAANEEEPDSAYDSSVGLLDEENSEDTSALDQTARDFWMKRSKTIIRCLIQVMIHHPTSFRIIIRMFPYV